MSHGRLFLVSSLLLLAAGAALADAGPGLHETPLYAFETVDVGTLQVWNSNQELHLKVSSTFGGVEEIQAWVGMNPAEMPMAGGSPVPELFPYQATYGGASAIGELVLSFSANADPLDPNLMDFSWGDAVRSRMIAVRVVLADGLVFADGFESGGMTAWSSFLGTQASTAERPETKNVGRLEAWAFGPLPIGDTTDSWCFSYFLAHPQRGQFIDAPVHGLSYRGPTQEGTTGPDLDNEEGGFLFFPGEILDFSIGRVPLGSALGAKKVSPLDLFSGADIEDPRVLGVARILQTLDVDSGGATHDGKILLLPEVVTCFEGVVASFGLHTIDFGDGPLVESILAATVSACNGRAGAELALISEADAKGNLLAGLNASGIFRKNISKTEDWGESKQKLDVMPVYFPGKRSNGDASLCIDVDGDGLYDEGEDTMGVPYEEWRLNGDPLAAECDPREFEDPEACQVTLIECREVAKPIVTAFTEVVDIYDDKVTADFWPHRFSTDIFAAVSRDDGTTWKRMNVSRMADLSSFDLKTGEPFPGTSSSPYLKINDNYVLVVWQSKFCRSGNPRYAINTCDDPETPIVETPESGCAVYCRGNPDDGTEVCEPDYPYDDPYHVTDIWGVRGHQQSVDYNEVDDVAELGIGEIPYSCLWAVRGVIVSQRELDAGTFNSLTVIDDNGTPDDPSDDVTRAAELGDIIWYKPERLTSGRRDTYIPVVGATRGTGFAIAWQEDPEGLRPGKGKGPGQGWSGAISNHKTDIWYSFLRYDDFPVVDEDFVPNGDPDQEFDDRQGLGRPKSLVPFSLPVRVSDNDMVNTDTLKVLIDSDGFPVIQNGTFVPLDPETIANQFCDGPDPIELCCDPNDKDSLHCEGLEGLYGNLTGTKRYAYLARSVDDDEDGVPDYQYYVDRGGTLDLCDTSGANEFMEELPGTSLHERWLAFINVAEAPKLVCVSSDGRLLDGDVSASRPNMQMQTYTKPDGTKSAWVLLGYEESKGMGHSLAAGEDSHDHEDDELVPGQEKPIKQDLGKNVIYHSFDFTEPDLVDPGHIVNLPALCGGLYPEWCDDPDNPTCSCTPGEPVPLYFDYYQENVDGTGEWIPDPTKLLQYRTEIARRTRFIVQAPSKVGASKTLGVIIYKQGQEGQGRPADVFVRRLVKSGTGNPYQFANFECNKYLDESFSLPACPNGAGDKPSAAGYMCNVWGEAWGDRLCGGVFSDPLGGYLRRDHVNLTSADIDLSVDAGPEDDTPDDPTDDIYGTDKVLLWTQHPYNLGDESYGHMSGTDGFSGMFSNARSHRGFVRGDFLVAAYAYSPNWAAARNGRDRYNFYIRKSFDGGQTWTTTPADLGGVGIHYCREWRTDPTVPDEDGTGNAPPVYPGFDPDCVAWCSPDDAECVVTGDYIAPGVFEPAKKVSQFDNNKETSSDPRVGATPPTFPLDGRYGHLPVLRYVEDEYVDNIFFVAWGGGDNLKSTGGTAVTPEAPPTDVWYTRSEDYGDHYLKVPWVIGGADSNLGYGETVWRYDFLAKGKEEEQGECQLRATPDGSKMYAIYHQMIPAEEDPDAEITRWYPWEPEESSLNDLWFRRIILWPDPTTSP